MASERLVEMKSPIQVLQPLESEVFASDGWSGHSDRGDEEATLLHSAARTASRTSICGSTDVARLNDTVEEAS